MKFKVSKLVFQLALYDHVGISLVKENLPDFIELEGEVVGLDKKEFEEVFDRRIRRMVSGENLPPLPEEMPVYKIKMNELETAIEIGDIHRDAINALIRYLKARE